MDHIHSFQRETEQWHFSGRIKYWSGYRYTHRKCRTDCFGEHSLADISCTDSSGCLIQCSCADGDIFSKSQFFCYFRQDFSDHISGFYYRCKLFFPDFQIVQHFLPIFSVDNIPVSGRADQGWFCGKFSCESVDEVVFNQEEFICFLENLWFIFFDPQDLGCRPAGFKAYLTCHLVAGIISEFAFQLPGFFFCPVIHPYNGISQGFTGFVQE